MRASAALVEELMPEVLYRKKAEVAHVGTYEFASDMFALNTATCRQRKRLLTEARWVHRSCAKREDACSTDYPSSAVPVGGYIPDAAYA